MPIPDCVSLMARLIAVALITFGSTIGSASDDEGAMHVPSTAPANSPAGLGSGAVAVGDYVYVSAQYGDVDGAYGDVATQTEAVLDKISALLTEAGTGLEQAVSAYVYLRHKSDFRAMNDVYRAYGGWPTTTHATAEGEDLDLAVRTTMSADLVGPPEALVQISLIALREGAERTIIQPPAWGRSNLPYPWGIRSGDTMWVSGLVPSEKIPEQRAQYTRSKDIGVNVSLVYSQVDTVLATAGESWGPTPPTRTPTSRSRVRRTTSPSTAARASAVMR